MSKYRCIGYYFNSIYVYDDYCGAGAPFPPVFIWLLNIYRHLWPTQLAHCLMHFYINFNKQRHSNLIGNHTGTSPARHYFLNMPCECLWPHNPSFDHCCAATVKLSYKLTPYGTSFSPYSVGSASTRGILSICPGPAVRSPHVRRCPRRRSSRGRRRRVTV